MPLSILLQVLTLLSLGAAFSGVNPTPLNQYPLSQNEPGQWLSVSQTQFCRSFEIWPVDPQRTLVLQGRSSSRAFCFLS
jgi:hypothetical protein